MPKPTRRREASSERAQRFPLRCARGAAAQANTNSTLDRAPVDLITIRAESSTESAPPKAAATSRTSNVTIPGSSRCELGFVTGKTIVQPRGVATTISSPSPTLPSSITRTQMPPRPSNERVMPGSVSASM